MKVYLITDCDTGLVSYGWDENTQPVDFDPPRPLSDFDVLYDDAGAPYIIVPTSDLDVLSE